MLVPSGVQRRHGALPSEGRGGSASICASYMSTFRLDHRGLQRLLRHAGVRRLQLLPAATASDRTRSAATRASTRTQRSSCAHPLGFTPDDRHVQNLATRAGGAGYSIRRTSRRSSTNAIRAARSPCTMLAVTSRSSRPGRRLASYGSRHADEAPGCGYPAAPSGPTCSLANGVSCTSGAVCANSSYFTIREHADEGRFSSSGSREVNLRLHLLRARTDARPVRTTSHCDQFARRFFPRAATEATSGQRCADRRGDRGGCRPSSSRIRTRSRSLRSRERRAALGRRATSPAKRPGFYPTEKTRGQVQAGSGQRRLRRRRILKLRFQNVADVEFRGRGKIIGGVTQRPRDVIGGRGPEGAPGQWFSADARGDGRGASRGPTPEFFAS